MRTLSILSTLVLLSSGPVHAADDERAIIEKAIKAHGGEEKLTKLKASTMKAKGKVNTAVGELEINQESMSMLPDKVKEIVETEVMGMKIRSVTIINGDSASIEVNGKDFPLKDELKEAIKQGKKQLQIARLLPLRDKKFTLEMVGEAKVNDRPAIGLRVSAKDMKDVNLYFDKKTNLLAKIEFRTVDPMNGQEVTEERIISDYQTVDGLAVPKKAIINRDGKKYLELTVEEVKYLEKIDEAEFKKQ